MQKHRSSKIIIIGAGIGGLTTAALLAQQNYDVTVLEAQTYPGGCASTWTHKGYRFESGATVAGGFQPDGPHDIVAKRLNLQWPVQQHDPAWVVHLPHQTIALAQDYTDVLRHFPESLAFWDEQRRIADIGWKLAAQGLPWPPRSTAEWIQLAKVSLSNFPQDIRLMPFIFSSVYDWTKRHNLHKHPAFMRFLDGQLLISAQTTTKNANALYGATALDLARQGVYHVEGGIGGLAATLVATLESLDGQVVYRQRVTRIVVERGRVIGVMVHKGRRGTAETFYPADFVIANLTPWDVDRLLAESSPRSLRKEVKLGKVGWGAFVVHLGVKSEAFPRDFPDHHQILLDLDAPLGETRSLFMSISPEWDRGRAPAGERAVTITTHTDVNQWWELLESDESAYTARKAEYAEKIITGIETVLPSFKAHITLMLPGSPVTYQFYTDRHKGMVGGFPQTSLLKMRGPRTGISNLRIVGDSIFPGQSTAGVTLGAIRVAQDISRSLSIHQNHHVEVKNFTITLTEAMSSESLDHQVVEVEHERG